VTSCREDCVSPLYLPEDRIVYAHKVRGSFQIEAIAVKGGEPLVLSHIAGSALPSDVLRDGRILFQAAFPLSGKATPELYTVYSDGSGVESYRGDHGAARFAGRQMSSADIVFASNGRLARFTWALAHQVDVVTPSGKFAGDVAQTSPGTFVGAWRPDSKSAYTIAKWSADGREITKVVSKLRADLVQPRALSARAIPNRHPSGLHDWDGANVLCLNAYTSKSSTIAEGSITGVRLYTQNAHGQTTLLGNSSVEKDGSFFVHVRADQPLKFELVDREGKVLERERGWYWMRRGEQRVCVGCHAGPERAPENAVPAVLVKSTEPVDLTHSHAQSGGH
jgi:Hydrazine synthase alpha subunit middle domain